MEVASLIDWFCDSSLTTKLISVENDSILIKLTK